MSSKKIKILLVEDDEDDYILLERLLHKIPERNYDLVWEKDSTKALKDTNANNYDVYLIDFRLGSTNGLDFIREAQDNGCTKPLILLTGVGDMEFGTKALRAGADDYLTKGEITPPILERAIRYAIERKDILLKQQQLTEEKIARRVAEQQKRQLEKAHEELMRNQERLELAQIAGNIGTFEWDLETDEVKWTPEVEALYGLKPHVFGSTYENWRQTLYPDDLERVEQDLQRSISEKGQLDSEFRVIWPDNSIHWIYAKGRTVYDTKGKAKRMLGVNMDITERKRLELQKDEFIGVASHELKTPVTSIKAYTQILLKRFGQKKDLSSLQLLSKMDSQVNRLTTLIHDLLDVTKIESGHLPLNKQEFNYDELVQEIVDEMQDVSAKHQIVIEGKTGQIVYADRDRVGQVLVNLISNAVKYSPGADKVIIRNSNGGSFVKTGVQDFGIGIPADKTDKVFQRFFRVGGAKNNTYPGLGLGLYITSEIIKRLNGKIWVESEIENGSTFYFQLPVKK